MLPVNIDAVIWRGDRASLVDFCLTLKWFFKANIVTDPRPTYNGPFCSNLSHSFEPLEMWTPFKLLQQIQMNR